MNLFSSWLAFDYSEPWNTIPSTTSFPLLLPPIRPYYVYTSNTNTRCQCIGLNAAKCWCLPLILMPLRRTFFIDTSYVQFFFLPLLLWLWWTRALALQRPALLDIVEYFIYKLVVALFPSSTLLSRRRRRRGGDEDDDPRRRRIGFKKKTFQLIFCFLSLAFKRNLIPSRARAIIGD